MWAQSRAKGVSRERRLSVELGGGGKRTSNVMSCTVGNGTKEPLALKDKCSMSP